MLNDTLIQYEINNDDGLLNLNPDRQLSAFQRRQCRHTLLGLFIAELSWIFLMAIYSTAPLTFAILVLIMTLPVLSWAFFGLKKSYISRTQTIFWLYATMQVVMYSMAEFTLQIHFVICGGGTLLVILAAYEIYANKKLTTTRILWYLYFFYEYIAYMSFKNGDFVPEEWPYYLILLDIYCLFGIITLGIILKHRDTLPRNGRYQLYTALYLWTIVFVVCLGGSISSVTEIPWQWFTVVNHVTFGVILYQFFAERRKVLFISHLNEEEKQQMFQVSDCLLVSNTDYLENPRESMDGGRPLADCILCYTNESKFLYAGCGHACVCGQCIVQWLKRGISQCPICRMNSPVIYEIKRNDGLIFDVVRKYRAA